MTPKCPDCKRDQDACACIDKDDQIKSLTKERDAAMAAVQESEILSASTRQFKLMEAQLEEVIAERDKLKRALEMVLGKVCWSVFTDEEELELEALKESA